jgi:hypothetical protein
MDTNADIDKLSTNVDEAQETREKVLELRKELDKMWYELEGASNWEHIGKLARRIRSTALEYHYWKRHLEKLTIDDTVDILKQ